LWGNVVDGGNFALLHLAGYAPVERWGIDHYSEIGLAIVGFPDQALVEAVDLREVAQDFGDADYGKVFGVDDRVAPGGSHAVSANAEETERPWSGICSCGDSRPRLSGGAKLRWLLLGSAAQGLDQLSAVHFA
jgi:hypothetical protein